MRGLLLLLVLCSAVPAVAEGIFSRERLYLGGGIGSNQLPQGGETKSEVQLLAGYRLGSLRGLDPQRFQLAVELGYMDTSDSNYDGGWITPVLSLGVAPQIDVLARMGADVGVHPDPMAGIGISYIIERNMAVRLEYVKRSTLPSVQFNVVYSPWFFR